MNDFFCLRETVILKENETGTLMENQGNFIYTGGFVWQSRIRHR